MTTATEERVPFRVVETELRGVPVLYLEYEGDILGPDGLRRTLPFRQLVGPDKPDPALGTVDLLGAAVLKLLRLYEAAMAERDQARAQVEAVLNDKRRK
jgi:hypothetical protein